MSILRVPEYGHGAIIQCRCWCRLLLYTTAVHIVTNRSRNLNLNFDTVPVQKHCLCTGTGNFDVFVILMFL